MKTEEEYLLELENKLISRLTEDYTAINKNIIFAFTLLFAFLLFEYGVIEEASVAGSKLKLADDKHLFILPALILIPYFLINYQINSIARLIKALGINSKKLLKINENARPFLISDLDFFSPGIAGIQLQVSKFAVRNYIDRRLIDKSIVKKRIPSKRSIFKIFLFTILLPLIMLRLAQRIVTRITWLGYGVFFLAIVYVIPLIIPLVIIIQKISDNLVPLDDKSILIIVILCFAILYTLWSNIFLYSFYFSELFGTLKEKFTNQSLTDTQDVFKSVINFYKGNKEIEIQSDGSIS